MGVAIDQLTAEQKKYLTSWEMLGECAQSRAPALHLLGRENKKGASVGLTAPIERAPPKIAALLLLPHARSGSKRRDALLTSRMPFSAAARSRPWLPSDRGRRYPHRMCRR